MDKYVMALDQGTTSSRAVIFDKKGNIKGMGQEQLKQIFPADGWVEQDPDDILRTQFISMREALVYSGIRASDISSIGITNQRETTLVWDATTGKCIYNAIVWQCRRTARVCDSLAEAGLGPLFASKTGLRPDAYFSASKIKWILDNVEGAREKAEKGLLRFGTPECWLIWNLTGGKVHVTDMSNASRTLLFNIHTLAWDEELCRIFDIPLSMLPRPVSNSQIYGYIAGDIPELKEFAGIPVCASIGDQQSALLGQGCIEKGHAKNTYGTGCFTLLNTGQECADPSNGLLTTIAWNIAGKTSYALEGSVFNAGSTIGWLQNGLKLFSTPAQCSQMAEQVPDNGGVYMVSAFTGLGAPFWDMYARGTIIGLTRGSNSCHIARAALEGIAYQVKALLDLMEKECGDLSVLRVDGGASRSDFLLQFQSDLLRIPIDRPGNVETTALGAAFLAGLEAGVWNSIDDIFTLRQTERIFVPSMEKDKAEMYYQTWLRAVGRSRDWIIE